MTETVGAVGLEAIFDWMEFTVHNYSVNDAIIHLLKLKKDDFLDLPKGKLGYKNQKIWGSGNIFLLSNTETDDDLPDKMGVHIIITGTGCRDYEKNRRLRDLIIRIAQVEKHKFNRIDIAIDDKTGEFIDFDKFEQEAIAENLSSLWYKWTVLKEFRIADGEGLGRTLYFGSKKSVIFMRVYDKHLEQKKRQHRGKKKKEPEPIKENINWTRMELVFRNQRATLLAMYLTKTDDIGRVIRGVLKEYIRFLQRPDPDGDMRKRRWKTADWWEKLIGDVQPLKLTIKPAEKTIEDMTNWLGKQISPTIAAVMEAHGGEINWLYQLIKDGGSRLKDKHIQAINQYLNRD